MKKYIARGASVAFLSAAAIVPLAGAAHAATPENAAPATWAAPDHDGGRGWHHHRRHCRFREDWWWETRWYGPRRPLWRNRLWGPGLGWNRGWNPFGGGVNNNVVIVF